MFPVDIAVVQAINIVKEVEWEKKHLSKMTPEQRQSYRDLKEKARKEAIEERRHRELCEAIRSTSFWRFGG